MSSNPLLQAVQHLVGFAVVMLALAGLWGLTALSGWLLRRVAPPAAPPLPAPHPEGPFDLGLSDEELVVVTAAVAAVVHGRHRIVSIQQDSGWGRAGRREIQASHRLR